MTSLYYMIRDGDLPGMVGHLDHSPRSLLTALQLVASDGTPDMLRELLRRGVTRENLDNVLGLAGHRDMVKALVDAGAVPTANAVETAAESGNTVGVEFLLAAGVTPTAEAVWQAARAGKAGTLRLLLGAGGDPDAVTDREWDAREGAALHMAVRGGHAEAVEVLLDAGADLDAVSPDRYRPMDLALGLADGVEVVAALRRRGARRMAPDDFDLTEAACRGHADRVATLLPDADPEDRGAALGQAVQRQDVALATAILEYPVSPGQLVIALGQAIAFDVPDVVPLLIAAGVDQNSPANYYHAPPIVLAASRGRTSILQALIAAGADLGARDSDGQTALEAARHYDRKAAAKLLKAAAAPALSPAARRNAVKAKLEKRDTWRPRFSYGGTAKQSYFGGSPWLRPGESRPACDTCDRTLALLAQIDLASMPPAVRQAGMLQVYRCVICLTFDAGGLVRIASDLAPSDVEEHFACQRIFGWHRSVDDYPRNEGTVLPPEERMLAQPLNRAVNKVGGWPTWIQDPAYPTCDPAEWGRPRRRDGCRALATDRLLLDGVLWRPPRWRAGKRGSTFRSSWVGVRRRAPDG